MAILGPLKDLDVVAYLRFASVYRSFQSAEDFEEEIASMRADSSMVEKAAQQPDPQPANTG
jgi:transcriptional repressor NrdR